MVEQGQAGQEPTSVPLIPRRPWHRRLIIDPLFRVGGVRRIWWADFYKYCLHNIDPCVPMYSISGSGEFAKEPESEPVIHQLVSQKNDRCWYAILERGIEEDRRLGLQATADHGRWSGKLVFLTSGAIESHFVICGDHVFLEAPHEPDAPPEDRPGVMVSNDPLLLDAARETYNRILRDKSTKWQWSLAKCHS